uniref:Uridylate-specific endoribonuclease n=1 Tax=Pelodiscus sinensis TaxID=13735 RepID=K7F9S7_PELSI|nr:poly(U)-specific endoribonuclease isoform X2 [Pelodiscus sinensis]|eukprot:XP_006134701.1 poly(U)-specific endoribonuclease isoform X2 [Pelodiscus sinensis]
MKTWILLLTAGIACSMASDTAEDTEETETGPPDSAGLYTDADSCKGRCHERYNREDECHCNTKCEKHRNCCEDYHVHCSKDGRLKDTASRPAHSSEEFSSSHSSITNEELLSISEQLYKSDVNRARKSDISINPQHLSSSAETRAKEDHAPEPLYTYVNEKLFSKPTYASFIRLLDNYQRMTGRGEAVSAEERKEQENFLREVMKTELMKTLYSFLHKKKRYSTQEEFVSDLDKMWFGLYSRGNSEGDSSGFEHVFSGEVKKGKVSGFHNWIRFYLLEKQGLVDYYGHNYDGPWTSYPDVLGMQFSWDGYVKEVGSAFIGCSPEFEFGLYTLCFIARPGKMCRLSLGGHQLGIQTYTWTKSTYGNDRKYIATAYVTSS